MRTIIELNVNLPMHSENYMVGGTVFSNDHKKVEITAIKEESLQCDNDDINFIYEVYADGQLFKQIVNTPVSLTYKLEVSQ